jgi:hypothetical protein
VKTCGRILITTLFQAAAVALAADAVALRLRDGSERVGEPADFASLPIAQVEELRLAEPMASDRWRLGFLVRTAAGDELRTEQLRLHEEKLSVDSPLTGLAQLPLGAVSAVWFVPPATLPESARREVEAAIASRARQDTLFIRKSGEWVRLEGVVKSLDDRSVMFSWQETEREVPLALAAALVLAGGQTPPVAREELSAVIGRDGSRMVGTLRGWSADSVALMSPTLGEVKAPLDSVAVVDALWGRSVWVSALEPAAVKEAGWLGVSFPWRRDASVSGKPLTMRGRVFGRGIGVHSRSSLAFALDGKFSLLTGVIGLDDAGGGLGDVEFVVRGDGKELMRAAMKAVDAPRPLRVDVRGVARLELLADFGGKEDTGDHADWAELRLVK